MKRKEPLVIPEIFQFVYTLFFYVVQKNKKKKKATAFQKNYSKYGVYPDYSGCCSADSGSACAGFENLRKFHVTNAETGKHCYSIKEFGL